MSLDKLYNEYQIIKQKVADKLIFKLSQIGYALSCDLLFTSRIPVLKQDVNLVNCLKTGDKIFISVLPGEVTINLYALTNILATNNIKVYFYLMYEPIVPLEVIQFLSPYALGFFLNNNVYDHPLIHMMPIGIRDCGNVVPMHKGFYHTALFEEGQKQHVNKDVLCVMCYSYTHKERELCDKALKGKSFVMNLNDGSYEKQPSRHCGKVPIWINYEYTHRADYTLSPRGCGEDTHRFYEAIYLDSIPIVKRTNSVYDKLYNIFPCLIVDEWTDVTEELLLSKREEYKEKIRVFKEKYPNAFTDVNSIHELLLQT